MTPLFGASTSACTVVPNWAAIACRVSPVRTSTITPSRLGTRSAVSGPTYPSDRPALLASSVWGVTPAAAATYSSASPKSLTHVRDTVGIGTVPGTNRLWPTLIRLGFKPGLSSASPAAVPPYWSAIALTVSPGCTV